MLHAAKAILLFLVLWRMTGALWPARSRRPCSPSIRLRAESVAWVAERKDVLSGLFFLLTLAAYVGYARRPFSLLRYLAVVAAFALGLMAKPMVVTLPFVLLLLDYWPLASPRRPAACGFASNLAASDLEKLPLLALSAASCAATLWAQRSAIAANDRIDFPLRLANALVSLVGYLAQWLHPANLAAMYPFPVSGVAAERVAAAVLVLLAISLAALFARRRTHSCWSDGSGIWECSCQSSA